MDEKGLKDIITALMSGQPISVSQLQDKTIPGLEKVGSAGLGAVPRPGGGSAAAAMQNTIPSVTIGQVLGLAAMGGFANRLKAAPGIEMGQASLSLVTTMRQLQSAVTQWRTVSVSAPTVASFKSFRDSVAAKARLAQAKNTNTGSSAQQQNQMFLTVLYQLASQPTYSLDRAIVDLQSKFAVKQSAPATTQQDTKKAIVDSLNDMVKQLIAFVKDLSDATSDRMGAVTRV